MRSFSIPPARHGVASGSTPGFHSSEPQPRQAMRIGGGAGGVVVVASMVVVAVTGAFNGSA